MKYILLLFISLGAFAQNTSKVAATTCKVFINGQTAEDGTLQLTRQQLKEAVISLDPAANLPEKTRIASFQVNFPVKPDIVQAGARINMQVNHAITKLKQGDTITIHNIKYTLPGDKTSHKYDGALTIMIVE